MFLAAFLTGSLAIRIKNQAKQAAQSAYRTKVLFDTNQLLQQAKDKNEIVSATSNQLIKLLEKDIVFYLADGEVLDTPHIFSATEDRRIRTPDLLITNQLLYQLSFKIIRQSNRATVCSISSADYLS